MTRTSSVFCTFFLAATALNVQAQSAREILDAAGVKGGLVVHLGCGDASLTAALHVSDAFLVHGLDSNPASVARAHQFLRARKLTGKVSVEKWSEPRLPYVDNLVNLVVWDREVGRITPVPDSEILRVLAPGGVSYIRDRGTWKRQVKPLSKDTDEWSHYLHDASGNAVAHDRVVGPPARVQWVADPPHTRSHEHIPSIQALVSSGGRIFYIADEAPIEFILDRPQWRLIARDAYNGLVLWKRVIPDWFPYLLNWGKLFPHIHRRVVAAGDRVFATLGYTEPLSMLDAATGKTLKVFENTRGADEIIFHEGVLVVAVRVVTEPRLAELDKLSKLARRGQSPLFKRETADPLVKEFRSTEWKAPRTLLALDPETGRTLWEKNEGINGLKPLSLSACAGQVFLQKSGKVVCLDLKTGEERWTVARSPLRTTSASAVICAGRKRVTALSPETGEVMWEQEPLLVNIRDVFIIRGSLWLGGFKPYHSGKGRFANSPPWGPYVAVQRDLSTGKVLKQIEPENPGHHHRCYINKATDRFIIGSRRGAEFIDLANGDIRWNSWVRGVCRYGMMPSNGLLYSPPDACACYVAAKLEGFYALAPRSFRSEQAPVPANRLKRGPAFGLTSSNQYQNLSAEDWPTFSHDSGRSNTTPAALPGALRPLWKAELSGKLSSLTAARGRVFVSCVEAQSVCTLDAATGRLTWEFTAGGRVDSPPTLYKGLALFGCRDGYVYALRASDGAIAWRFLAARQDRRIVARGQLESVFPVFGSVLIRDGNAFLSAGRSSYLDGGIDLLRIRPETGELLSRTPIYSSDPKTGRQPPQTGPSNMPGVLSDILSSDDDFVYLRETVFDPQGIPQRKGNPHLLTMTGFLDDTWPHRSYWIFGTRCSISIGCGHIEKGLVHGRLLAFNASSVFGYGRKRLDWSSQLNDADYQLFAMDRASRTLRWQKRVPIRVKAMIVAGGVLYAAGRPGGSSSTQPVFAGSDSLLLALSVADGSLLWQSTIEDPPSFNSMAAAGGRLFLATEHGRVLCFARNGKEP